MKLTVKQLKQLIKEQVEEEMEEAPAAKPKSAQEYAKRFPNSNFKNSLINAEEAVKDFYDMMLEKGFSPAMAKAEVLLLVKNALTGKLTPRTEYKPKPGDWNDGYEQGRSAERSARGPMG